MKLYLPSEIERKPEEAISQENIDEFSKLASPLSWGKPSWSASQLLLRGLDDDTERLWFWTKHLANHKDPHTRRYACIMKLCINNLKFSEQPEFCKL